MPLPLVHLMSPPPPLPDLVDESPHEHADGAVVRTYAIPAGHVLVTEWKGLVHAVIYQAPEDDEGLSEARNEHLFRFFGDGHAWTEILDNGFGKTYRRADEQRFALWSYAMDFNTFGTMEFHAVMWGR